MGRGAQSRSGGCVRTTWAAGEAEGQSPKSSSFILRLEQTFLQLKPEHTATQAGDFQGPTPRQEKQTRVESCTQGAQPARGCEDAGRFSEGRPSKPSRLSPARDPLLPSLFHRLALETAGCTGRVSAPQLQLWPPGAWPPPALLTAHGTPGTRLRGSRPASIPPAPHAPPPS